MLLTTIDLHVSGTLIWRTFVKQYTLALALFKVEQSKPAMVRHARDQHPTLSAACLQSGQRKAVPRFLLCGGGEKTHWRQRGDELNGGVDRPSSSPKDFALPSELPRLHRPWLHMSLG